MEYSGNRVFPVLDIASGNLGPKAIAYLQKGELSQVVEFTLADTFESAEKKIEAAHLALEAM